MNDQIQTIVDNFLNDLNEGVDNKEAEQAAVLAVKELAGGDEVVYQTLIKQVATKVEAAMLAAVEVEASEAKREVAEDEAE